MIDRILFLDVDGVLNRFGGANGKLLVMPTPGQQAPFLTDKNVVEAVNAVLHQCRDETRIVVSSSWRSACNGYLDFAKLTGIDSSLIHQDWRTVRTTHGMRFEDERPWEVNEWLSRHPEVQHWCAVDDTDYTFDQKHFVRTNHEIGLTYDDLEVIMRRIKYRLQGGHVVQRMRSSAK